MGTAGQSRTACISGNGRLVGRKGEKQQKADMKVGATNRYAQYSTEKWDRIALREPAVRGKGRDSLQAAEPPVISPDRAESLNLPAVLVFLRCMKYNGFWNETIKTEQ